MEYLDVYNQQRERTGRVIPRGGEVCEGERLLVVHVCVLNRANKLLIQRRQLTKDRYPGCWDLSAGGFVHSGEESLDAVIRKFPEEELGLTADRGEIRFLFTEPFSYVLDDFYLVRAEADPVTLRLQTEEVSEAKWASRQEILRMIADGSFVDYNPACIEQVFQLAVG